MTKALLFTTPAQSGALLELTKSHVGAYTHPEGHVATVTDKGMTITHGKK